MTSPLSKLTLADKLLICGGIFCLPLAVLLYYAVSGFERQIEFTSLEIAGVRVLQPLCNLAIALNARRVDDNSAATEGALAEIRKEDTRFRSMAPATAPLAIGRASAKDPDLAAKVYASFPQLAEAANLVLDPEMDSYYLANLAVVRLPALHEELSHDPAALDQRSLEGVRHAVAVVSAEHERKHHDRRLGTELQTQVAALQAAQAATRLNAASSLWQTTIAHLGTVLDERRAATRRNELTALLLTLGAAVLAATMLFVVVQNVSAPLRRATSVAEDIVEGRLHAAEITLSQSRIRKYLGGELAAQDGHAHDEVFRLLHAFRTMANSLGALLRDVSRSCSEVDASTVAIADTLRQFETMVAEQAASTNQVVASSKEISATVDELAGSMRTVSRMAADAADLATGGLAGLAKINNTMQETIDGSVAVSRVLNGISTTAGNINSVLDTMVAVANHTNLISLNAAIQAEKAGEHAAGFKTVGLEIRRIADQTAIAALDIEKMLADMRSAVAEGTRVTAEYADRAKNNSETVARITNDLQRSIEYTRNLEPHFQAANGGMQTQTVASRQIVEAMQQLSAATGQTREALIQFREVAGRMRFAVDTLQAQVGRFS